MIMTIVLKVKAKKDGYRRAGRKFSSSEDTVIPFEELTKEQIAEMKGDNNLLVSESSLDALANADAALAEKASADERIVTIQQEAEKRIAEIQKAADERIAKVEEAAAEKVDAAAKAAQAAEAALAEEKAKRAKK